MTYLCVPIFVHTIAQAKRDVASAIEAGAEMIELRIDTFDGDLSALLGASILPAIVTCRANWEGGQSPLSDKERGTRLVDAADSGAAYVDYEWVAAKRRKAEVRQAVANRFKTSNTKLILSSHYFAQVSSRPPRLINRLLELNDSIADISKLVWTARTIRDNQEAFEILSHRQKPTIALCMGEAGLLSRILAKKFGGFLTFASLNPDAGTAPGQVTIADMKKVYRWDAIGAETKVYGVVGSPIMHSMSPAIHNAAFETIGFDGVYVPLLVNPGYESFKAFMETFVQGPGPLRFHGLSVTIPHKENALRYLKEKSGQIEPLAESIGAVNTIKVEHRIGTAHLTGKNTDYSAILDCITDKLKITREQLADYRVAVIGAGGTGRTAVAALSACGATVVVYNRTKERADELAAEFNGRTGKVVAAPMEKLCDSCCHIYMNTTSVGMYPKVEESPFGEQTPKFTPETLVFDAVYNPMKTRLLQQAEQAGAKTVNGVEMFLRQAVGQFEFWTGKTAPSQLMRQVIETRLTRSI